VLIFRSTDRLEGISLRTQTQLQIFTTLAANYKILFQTNVYSPAQQMAVNPLKHNASERHERIVEEENKRQSHGLSERKYILGEGKSIILLEGLQASPIRPSANGSMKVKGSKLWFEVEAMKF
jgi:hypothetical protein